MSKSIITNEQLEATQKVYSIRETTTDNELSERLGISKVTLYTRLQINNWNKGELCLISSFEIQ